MMMAVPLGIWQYVEISLWLACISFLGIVGSLFVRDYLKNKNQYFFWISLFFYLFVIARIIRLIVRFYIGEPPIGETLEGDAFVLESIYTILSYIGLFFVYFAIERTLFKKSHYFFSIVVWVTCVISIIDFVTRALFYLNILFFVITVAALPLIFIGLAIKSSGSVRTNAIYVAIGVLLFILAIALDIPDGRILFYPLGEIFLAIVPPVLMMVAIVIMRRGFQTKV